MSEDRKSFTMETAVSGHAQWVAVWRWCKAMLLHGNELCVEIVSAKTREQEKLYHSCFSDLARDCLLGGEKNDAEAWKRALLQAFYEETRDDPQFRDDWATRAPRMVPSLDGDGGLLHIGVESKRFTKNLATGFITFVHATGDLRGVRWSRTSLGRDVPEEFFRQQKETAPA